MQAQTGNAGQNASFVREDGRRTPVIAEADLVVAGAGPGGFAAALQAARMGRSVILVERFDMPGGVHTSGLQGAAGPGVGGIHSELMQRFEREGYIYVATEKSHPGWAGNVLSHYERNLKPDAAFQRASFNPEGAGCVMTQMLAEAGVETFYGASLAGVSMRSNGAADASIDAILIETSQGRFAIRGKMFVDGTGVAELAAQAGAPYISGGGGQPAGAQWDGVKRPIPGGLLWIMDNIDFGALRRYQESSNDPALANIIEEARAAGDIPDALYRPRMAGKNVYGEAYIGKPAIDMSPMLRDGTYILWQNVPYEWALHMDESARDASRARRELRAFINAEAQFLRKYVPGFEQASLTDIGRFVGVRDGRHPIGEHMLSIDDVLAGRRYRDAVTKPMTKTFFWDAYRKHEFEVPFGCFLPKKIDNLIFTGASMSFTYEMIFMVMRNFPWCTQTGEIAGFAAARALEKNIRIKELEWREPYF